MEFIRRICTCFHSLRTLAVQIIHDFELIFLQNGERAFEGLLLFSSCRTDGSFAVNDIPSGSYVVEVVSPGYRFEPVRVDITSKGKMR